jgi:pimeloyl-ACP methyl ester carboxylesterase
MRTSASTQRVQVDGASLHVQQAGTGQPLLAIGGAGAGVVSYRRLAPLMAERYRFISYDRRGMDSSTGRTDIDLDVANRPTTSS